MSAPAGEGEGAGPDRRARVEEVLGEILRRMDLQGRVETRDAADGGISVALTLEGEAPESAQGRRSTLADALQFLLNKILNRPGVERRWITVGIGAHPEPRGSRPARPPRPEAPASPGPPARAAPARAPQAGRPSPAREADERTAEVAEDALLSGAVRALAERSGRLGRFYALLSMKADDRARVLKAVEGVSGVSVTVEGEGRSRRVVFTPDRPVPLPKRNLPEMDDDEDLEES